MVASTSLEMNAFSLLNATFKRLGWSRGWQRASSGFVFDSTKLASIDDSEKRVFQIVGVARSGTTLLCRAIDLHPGLVCFNEPFSDLYRHNEFARFSDGDRYRAFPTETLARLAKREGNEMVGFKETFRDRAGISHSLISERFLKANEKDGACKTIAVMRDPRDVWCSLLANNERLGSPRISMSATFTDTWLKLAKWVVEQDLFFVRYEDLVERYESELRRVVQFLGVEFHPEMLDRSLDLTLPPSGTAPTSGDPRALSSRPVTATSVNRFVDDIDHEERSFIEAECGEAMREFGYPA
ncbi:MAG: sulfotransferase [bacterium]|nr:sulfotransferase [bacterium]